MPYPELSYLLQCILILKQYMVRQKYHYHIPGWYFELFQWGYYII